MDSRAWMRQMYRNNFEVQLTCHSKVGSEESVKFSVGSIQTSTKAFLNVQRSKTEVTLCYMNMWIQHRKKRKQPPSLLLSLTFICLWAYVLYEGLQFYSQKRLWHKCLPPNFANFFRNPSERLLQFKNFIYLISASFPYKTEIY